MNHKNSSAAAEMLRIFGSVTKPAADCESCAKKKYAFGVRVCGIGLPEPKGNQCKEFAQCQ